MNQKSRRMAIACAAGVAAVGTMLAGCRTAPLPPHADRVAPALQLLDSKPLVLAEDCGASGSFFVEFTVLSDGRTGQVKLPAAPPCVQEALSAWVGSFRYIPPARESATAIEWMLVTAGRGS